MNSKITTILIVDIVGYTKKTSELSRDKLNQLHDVFDNNSLPIFAKYHGSVLKKTGDAFFVTFDSPTNALLSAMSLQNLFRIYNEKNKFPLTIRAVVHSGEVLIRKNDIYGDTVNTAARIEEMTKPGDILFTESVFQTMNKNEIPYVHIGPRKFKGLKFPVRLFKVKKKETNYLKLRRFFRKVKSKLVSLLILILLVVIIVASWVVMNKFLF